MKENKWIYFKTEKLKNAFLFILSSGILLIPTFWNGYPLVYSDSGIYICAANWRTVPVDRCIYKYYLYFENSNRIHKYTVYISSLLMLILFIFYILKNIDQKNWVFLFLQSLQV